MSGLPENGIAKSPDKGRLAVHTITTKPWSLAEAVDNYSRQGIDGISVWVEAIENIPPAVARQTIEAAGLKVPALVRGGFFCDASQQVRVDRIDHNRRLIDTAAELGAEMLVMVVGATPGVGLATQRDWVCEGICGILEDAQAAGVKIAIEPLHPMYAADKSCINRLAEARQLCDQLKHAMLGVAVDVYHVWWDPDLSQEIAQLGADQRIFGFHICDWRVPTRDLLNDRALMGDGCIDIRSIRQQVEQAGFRGWNEVEIFSDEHWAKDQSLFLRQIVDRYPTC